MDYKKQHEIAGHLGISESLLSRIISGKRPAKPVVAKRLSILTSSDIEMWLFDTDINLSHRKVLIKKITPVCFEENIPQIERISA